MAIESFQIPDLDWIKARFRKAAIWSVIIGVVLFAAGEWLGYIDFFEGIGRPPLAKPH